MEGGVEVGGREGQADVEMCLLPAAFQLLERDITDFILAILRRFTVTTPKSPKLLHRTGGGPP